MGAAGVDGALDRWCVRWLGSPVAEVLFAAGSLSAVAGVRLADDREVVVKTRPPAARLEAAHAVHRHVWERGYPAPQPLVPPTPLDPARTAGAERLVRGGGAGGRRPDAACWAASLWTLAVDAKDALAGGSPPTLTEAEAAGRLSLAGA